MVRTVELTVLDLHDSLSKTVCTVELTVLDLHDSLSKTVCTVKLTATDSTIPQRHQKYQK
jgi:hypothetical protein